MNFDALRRRRATYQRSKTLGSLPLHLIHQGGPIRCARDSSEAQTITEELNLLTPIDDSPVRVLSSETLRSSTGAGDVPYSVVALGVVSPASDGQPYHFRPSTSPRRRPSPSDFAMAHPAAAGGGQGHQGDGALVGATKRSSLERSRSISAVLFTKVKDRIVEKMFQTATEGPQLAAIVQERRQRAADEYEARLQTGALLKGHRKDQGSSLLGGHLQVGDDKQFQLQFSSNVGGASRRVRGSLGSSPIKELPITEEGSGNCIGEPETHERIRMARAAFRRRSISQDAAQMGMMLLQPGGGGGGHGKPRTNTGSQNLHSSGVSGSQSLTVSAGGSQNFEGIVCSNDDFQAIVKMGQLAMQTGNAPQKPRLSFRALSFSHGSFAASTTTRQSGEIMPLSNHVPLSNCIDDESPEGTVGSDGTNDRESVTANAEVDLDRTTTQSVSTATPNFNSTTTATTAATTTTTTGVASDVRRRGADCPSGSPTTMMMTTLATVPEIEYDENGQTWDVYGAEFDPEILGDAIQLHLKRLIERNLLDMSCSQENSPPPPLTTTTASADLASTRHRNDEQKLDRKRSYRPEVKKRDDDGSTNSIFNYLCIFSKRRHSSDETT